jgi:ComF family protein
VRPLLSPNRIGNLRLYLSSQYASSDRERIGKKDLAPTSADLVFRIKRTFLDLLFPPRCVGCRKVGGWLCSECRSAIELLRPPLCPRCGLPTAEGKLCLRCQRAPLQIDRVRSVTFFDGPMRKAIHRLKYSNSQSLAAPLGEMLVSYWQDVHLPADVIIPVPLHTRRLRERGYNQAALLARELGKGVGLPVLENALVRVRETSPQVDLNAEERKENVQGAFHCPDDQLAGKSVLLVDDVYTTGATLEACSLALKQRGVCTVWSLTLARAR